MDTIMIAVGVINGRKITDIVLNEVRTVLLQVGATSQEAKRVQNLIEARDGFTITL